MQTDLQPDSRSNIMMHRILDDYYCGGTDAVRALLRRNNTPDEKIEAILAQLQQNFSNVPTKGTMSPELLQSFINNIYVVRTCKSEDWIASMYQSMKEDARQARERKNLMRVAFFEALAAIVKDEPVTMADDNPFKRSIIELVEAIELWKSQRV